MNRILVIGYGNPYRSDDGIGFHAADRLQAMIADATNLHVIATPELKLAMVEDLSRSDLTLIVGANSDNAEPGTVRRQRIDPGERWDRDVSQVTPYSLVAATNAMYKQNPEAVLISVTGEHFGFGSRLSPKVEAALPQLFDQITSMQALCRRGA